jgi:uncharacterized membrane protein
MSGIGKYVWTAILVALAVHLAVINFIPTALMNVAFKRIGAGRPNEWHVAERVTSLSRSIVRPSPDFAYSACAFDLSNGPLVITAAPWDAYWSLSLYAANSDNFYVIDDREARFGAEITVVRAGQAHPEGASMVVESPSGRGIALIRRLAPTLETYNGAVVVAREDVCASAASLRSGT